MDTNLVAVLVALASQKVAAPSQTLAIWQLAFSALAPLLAAIAVWITRQNLVETTKLKEHINSRMDELQIETKKASFAEGAAAAGGLTTKAPEGEGFNPAQIQQIKAMMSKPNNL